MPTVNRAIELRFNLGLVQDIVAERGEFENQDYWSARKGGLTEVCVATAGCVAACLQSGPKNQHSDWFRVYLCANCMLVSYFCVCLCGKDNIVTLFRGSHFQN